MNHIFIALGSNIEKEKNLPLAIHLLGKICHIMATSSIYETIPVGLRGQPNFLNAAILIESDLSASQLKADVLDTIEKKLKRVRMEDKNAPRTIDMDIVLYDDQVFEYEHIDGRRRQVPDPDLLKFAHMAVPIAELAPDMLHPETAEPLADIAQRLTKSASNEIGRSPLWKRTDIKLQELSA